MVENKTTTELLETLCKLENASDNKQDWDKFGEVFTELLKRPPFSDILGTKDDANDFTHEERLDKLEEEVKLLKRHSHNEKTGDVMVRI